MQHEPTLRDDVDAFLERRAMAPVTFGRGALNDPHFVNQLRAGRRVWPETEAKVRKFMREYDAAHPSPPRDMPDEGAPPPPFTGKTETRTLSDGLKEAA